MGLSGRPSPRPKPPRPAWLGGGGRGGAGRRAQGLGVGVRARSWRGPRLGPGGTPGPETGRGTRSYSWGGQSGERVCWGESSTGPEAGGDRALELRERPRREGAGGGGFRRAEIWGRGPGAELRDAGQGWGDGPAGSWGVRRTRTWVGGTPGRGPRLPNACFVETSCQSRRGARAAPRLCAPARAARGAGRPRLCPGADRQLPGPPPPPPAPGLARFLRPLPARPAPARPGPRFLRARRPSPPLPPPASPHARPPLLLSNGGDAGSGRGLGCAETPAPPAAAAAAAAARAPCAPPRGGRAPGEACGSPPSPPPAGRRRGDLGPGAPPPRASAPCPALPAAAPPGRTALAAAWASVSLSVKERGPAAPI